MTSIANNHILPQSSVDINKGLRVVGQAWVDYQEDDDAEAEVGWAIGGVRPPVQLYHSLSQLPYVVHRSGMAVGGSHSGRHLS